jgi:hypothetical protein
MDSGWKILTVAVSGAISFYVAQLLVTDLCDNTTGWSTITVSLFCTIFPVAVCIAVIFGVFKLLDRS